MAFLVFCITDVIGMVGKTFMHCIVIIASPLIAITLLIVVFFLFHYIMLPSIPLATIIQSLLLLLLQGRRSRCWCWLCLRQH